MSKGGYSPDLRIVSKTNILKFQDRSGKFVASVETEMFRALRYERPLSLITVNALGAPGTSRQGMSSRQMFFDNQLRRFASDILRMPDFWGRVDRETFAMVFPETPLIGAERAIERLVASRSFDKLLGSGEWRVVMGAAECSPETTSVEAFVAAARTNAIWESQTKTKNHAARMEEALAQAEAEAEAQD